MKKTSREIEIQEEIMKKLSDDFELFPFSLIFTYCKNDGGMLSITFYLPQDIDYFLKCVDYKSQCDQSGYQIFKENNTVILSGVALLNLINKL